MQAISLTWLYSRPMSDKTSHLRKLRIAAGLSVRELARQIDQQPSNVSYWETTGKTPRSEVLVNMAKALGVSVEQLLGEAPARKGQSNSAGKLGRVFESVSKLPRRQQQKILDVVEALVAQQAKAS
jgi:transcriptional regulator with XRE-family HTH domain